MSKFIEDVGLYWLSTKERSKNDFFNFYTVLLNGRDVAVTAVITGFAPGWDFSEPNPLVGKTSCHIQRFEYEDKNGVKQSVGRNSLELTNHDFISNCLSVTFVLQTVLADSRGLGTIFYYGETITKTTQKVRKSKYHLMVKFDKKTGEIKSTNQIEISKNIKTEDGIDDLLKRTVEQYSSDLPKNMSYLYFENTQLEQNKNYKIDIKTKKMIEFLDPDIDKDRSEMY